MPQLHVDSSACQGHALCHGVDPEMFPLDDDGYCAVTTVTIDEGELLHAKAGATACPERAIDVIE